MEEWKGIKDFPDYMISNLGRVKSLKNYRQWKPGRFINQYKNSNGYLYVVLYFSKIRKHKKVHLLVLETFVGKKPGHECNHKNGIKADNRLNNLEWMTRSENIKHSYKNGLIKRKFGILNISHKLTNDDVVQIKKYLKNKRLNLNEISIKFNVSEATISKIKNGKIWNYINV